MSPARWTSPPLPECHVCERPMGRQLWHDRGGICGDCQKDWSCTACPDVPEHDVRDHLSVPTDGALW